MNVPIGIVTRDRTAFLDATLRSLSATTLPASTPLTIYDDASTDPHTRDYLYGIGPIPLMHPWPTDWAWRKHGLSILNTPTAIVGIADKVPVINLSETSLGVVNASRAAIHHLFASHPASSAILLLQDDVLFNENWYVRMLSAAADFAYIGGKPVGLLAGMRLNRSMRHAQRKRPVIGSSATGQCLYITRDLYNTMMQPGGWLQRQVTRRTRFDDYLHYATRNANFASALINPFVCQHIGVRSLVRPKRGWKSQGAQGRIGLYSSPPYALGTAVRKFE